MVVEAGSVRERALAAWQERSQEMAVEAERRRLERSVRLLETGMHGVLRVLEDTEGSAGRPVAQRAAEAGIEVVDYYGRSEADSYAADPWVRFRVDGIDLRYTSRVHRVNVVEDCGRCGGMIDRGSVGNLAEIGRAVSEDACHRCPDPEPVWEGDLTVSAAMSKSDDPALVLLDALQGYIHSAVEGAVRGEGFRNDDEAIALSPTFPARSSDDVEPF